MVLKLLASLLLVRLVLLLLSLLPMDGATGTPSVIDLNSSARVATDALAAEVLDATDGAFTTVADAIEAGFDAVTPSGFDRAGSVNSVGGPRVSPTPTLGVPAVNTAGKALGLDDPTDVTPTVFDPITNDPTGRKPGLQTHSKAPLSTHTQTSTHTPTLGVPGASAITRIGTGSSDALGNTDTRANESNKSDIESTSVSSKSPPTDNQDATLPSPEDPHTSDQPIRLKNRLTPNCPTAGALPFVFRLRA